MKLLREDLIFTFMISTLTVVASTLLYLNITKKIEQSNAEQIGTITFKKRVAQRKYAGRMIWEPLAQESPLYNYDSVRTEEDSLSILKLKDGSEIELDENTLIVLNFSEKGSTIDFSRGSLFAKKAAGTRGLNIKSANSTIEIDKGDVNLSKKADEKELNLNVSSGLATITTGSQIKEVTKDEVALITQKGADVTKNTLILKSPSINRYFLTLTGKKTIDFSWEMERKEKIAFEVGTNRSFSNMVHKSTPTGTSRSITFGPGDYYWRVRSLGKSGGRSETRKFSILEGKTAVPIAPPNNAKFTFVNKQPLVSFKWKTGKLASAYRVEIASDPKMQHIVMKLESATTTIATDKIPEGTYYWRVKNIYSFGGIQSEDFKGIRKIRITREKTIEPPQLLYPPNNEKLSSILLAAGKLVFNWEINDDLEQYDFEISRDEAFTKPLLNGKTKNAYYSVSERLKPGTYYWRVTGTPFKGKQRPRSNVRRFTVTAFEQITHLTPPQDKALSPFQNGGKIRFSWKDPNRGSHYLLEVAKNAEFTVKILSQYVKKTSFMAKNIKPGTFYWRVSLVDKKKNVLTTSKATSAFMAELLTDPLIVYPKNQSTIDMTDKNVVSFRWKGVPRATQYSFKLFHLKGDGDTLIINRKTENTALNFTNMRLFDTGNFRWHLQALQYKDGALLSKSQEKQYFFTITLRTKIPAPVIVTPGDIFIE